MKTSFTHALCLCLALSGLQTASAALASDNASNYASVWNHNDNGGTGFGAWDLTNNNNNPGGGVFAGYFIGDSTAGAGDINTAGESFGIYANPGSAFATAQRSFSAPLAVGETFRIDLGVNFDNGNKGLNLVNSTQGEVFNFNVGFGGSVSSNNATLNPTTGSYNYGGPSAIFAEFTMLTSSEFSYNISRSSTQGIQGTLFSGTVSGLTSAPGSFALYNSGTDNSDAENNLYFNSLEVVPEPGVALLFLAGIGLVFFLRKR